MAVKMTDHYLSKAPIHRQMLQLVGSTAILIACKFEVRIENVSKRHPQSGLVEPCSLSVQELSPPPVEDFLYICDDAYQREELISMEASILQTLSFDINIPIPYRFLRRYARVSGLHSKVLCGRGFGFFFWRGGCFQQSEMKL